MDDTDGMDGPTFDAVMRMRREISRTLLPEHGRRLSAPRMLVLTLLAVSSDRAYVRRTARAIREGSVYEQQIRRVYITKRLCKILDDLHRLGLLCKQVPEKGPAQYSLTPQVHEHMQRFLARVRPAQR